MKSHGLSGHGLYPIWIGIKSRCLNKNRLAYKRYGGRGITICPAWEKSPEAFIRWALAAGWRKPLQIDRKDNDGPYSPENCRFVTASINSSNRRDTRYLKIDGERISFPDAAKKYGINVETIRKRIKAGMPDYKAIINADLRAGRTIPHYRSNP